VKGMAADKAGVRLGDIILKFNGKAIDKYTELPRLAGATVPGSQAVLEIWRAGKTITISLLMGEAPADDKPITGDAKTDEPSAKKTTDKTKIVANQLGITFIDLPKDVRDKLQLTHGVLVDKAEGTAERAGLSKGDVIVGIAQQDAIDPAQANALIAAIEPGKPVALLVKRGEQAVWVVLRTPAK
jgi:serine protease Do